MKDFIFIIKTRDTLHWFLPILHWSLGLVMSGGWKMTLKLRMLLRRGGGRRVPDMSEVDWPPHTRHQPTTSFVLSYFVIRQIVRISRNLVKT